MSDEVQTSADERLSQADQPEVEAESSAALPENEATAAKAEAETDVESAEEPEETLPEITPLNVPAIELPAPEEIAFRTHRIVLYEWKARHTPLDP